MYWCQQVWKPNQNNFHEFPQAWGRRKYGCPVWVCPTDNFMSHQRKNISINECWPNQLEQTSQQSMIVISKLKLQRNYFEVNQRMKNNNKKCLKTSLALQ